MGALDHFRLDGWVAVIPGGGGGIGSALAVALPGRGEGRRRRPDPRIARRDDRARARRGQRRPRRRRRRDRRGGQRAGHEERKKFGRVDIIVNAVGGGAGKALHNAETYPRSDWDWIMDLNVRSTVLPTQAAVRQMIAQGSGGRVLNISSVRASLGINAGYSAYVAAKGAVSSLTRQWATEWAKHGIRVNAIMPTFVDTPQVAMLLDDPAFKAGIVEPDPAWPRRRDARHRRPGDLPVLGRRVVRDGPDPRYRRRPDGDPVTSRPAASSLDERHAATSTRRPSCAAATRAS